MPVIEGFLPFSRANLLMDFVVVAMALIIPILLFSTFLVRIRKCYEIHRKIQITLGLFLGSLSSSSNSMLESTTGPTCKGFALFRNFGLPSFLGIHLFRDSNFLPLDCYYRGHNQVL